MPRRQHWNRPIASGLSFKTATELARAELARLDPPADDLRLCPQATCGAIGHFQVGFEMAVDGEPDPVVAVLALVDRVTGEAIADDYRPVVRSIHRAELSKSVDALMRILGSNLHVANLAGSALVRIRSEESERAVRTVLDRTGDSWVRGVLVRALGLHGDFSVELLLRVIAEDDDDGLQWAARSALETLATRSTS
jgi:hypothetical protein